ncbi:MAG: hypothetical protein AAGH81_17580 [Bacteroidota bacterium]
MFAAQPYEMMLGPGMNDDPNGFLVQGRLEPGEKVFLRFNDFKFEMTSELHDRLGLLYDMLRNEYRKRIIKKT